MKHHKKHKKESSVNIYFCDEDETHIKNVKSEKKSKRRHDRIELQKEVEEYYESLER